MSTAADPFTQVTPQVRRVVGFLFNADERGQAVELLARHCAVGLPLAFASTTLTERVMLASLKLSGGRLDRLGSAIELARSDWRDALVVAGFSHDVNGHLRWIRQLECGAG